jgi:hypothetical protein
VRRDPNNSRRMLDGEAMDYVTILIVVLVVLAAAGILWLHFGR